jgi:uncharacterized repeat protein (TIGR03803 family)
MAILYGTAAHGGASHGGVVFKLAPDGTTYTVLYSFCRLPSCSDGSTPEAGLIADSIGNLYGTTHDGSGSGCGGLGCGVVFKVSPGGTETVLYSFTGASVRGWSLRRPDYRQCRQSLWHDRGWRRGGQGVVFKVSPDGTFRVLYSFCGLGSPAATGLNPSPVCLPTAAAISIAPP